MKLRRYKRLFEITKNNYKAFYNPNTDYWFTFNTNLVHSEICKRELKMSSLEAEQAGYYEIYVYETSISIRSFSVPNERQFMATRYKLEENSRNINQVNWDTKTKSFSFPGKSFFTAEKIAAGR